MCGWLAIRPCGRAGMFLGPGLALEIGVDDTHLNGNRILAIQCDVCIRVIVHILREGVDDPIDCAVSFAPRDFDRHVVITSRRPSP